MEFINAKHNDFIKFKVSGVKPQLLCTIKSIGNLGSRKAINKQLTIDT